MTKCRLTSRARGALNHLGMSSQRTLLRHILRTRALVCSPQSPAARRATRFIRRRCGCVRVCWLNHNTTNTYINIYFVVESLFIFVLLLPFNELICRTIHHDGLVDYCYIIAPPPTSSSSIVVLVLQYYSTTVLRTTTVYYYILPSDPRRFLLHVACGGEKW